MEMLPIELQINEVSEQYKGLQPFYGDNDKLCMLSGLFEFNANFKDENIQDTYLIEISIPKDYPSQMPIVNEIGGRISDSFHKYSNSSLCLGIPLEIQLKFSEHKTLLCFIEKILIPYLYAFSYYEKRGTMPYGTANHDEDAEYLFYKKHFANLPDHAILDFLGILASKKLFKGHLECPCGSSKIFRKCHGPLITQMSNLLDSQSYYRSYGSVFNSCIKRKSIEKSFLVSNIYCQHYVKTKLEEERRNRIKHKKSLANMEKNSSKNT